MLNNRSRFVEAVTSATELRDPIWFVRRTLKIIFVGIDPMLVDTLKLKKRAEGAVHGVNCLCGVHELRTGSAISSSLWHDL